MIVSALPLLVFTDAGIWEKKKKKKKKKNLQVIVISPLRVLYPDLQTRLTRARSARVGVSVNGYCTIGVL